MNPLKVCVYAICKNESKFVDTWVKSMREADRIVVTDTGSDDDTVERLRACGVTVYVDAVNPWRFDAARNLSLSHVPENADICVCTDLDERFEPGWRGALEKAWLGHQPKHTGKIAKTGRYLYNWSLKPDGSPGIQFYYFKVHERHGFRWKCPVHEYVQYVGSAPLETVYIDGMVLNHYPDPMKSRGSYLPLLETAVREAPEDERMRYYLGREYMYKGQWKKSADMLQSYLSMPNARWNEERCAAMRWIANSCSKMGRIKEAYGWYFRAIAEGPHMRDPFVEFANMCYKAHDWPMAFCMANEALKIGGKSKTFVNMGYSWDSTPDDLCAIAAYWMGLTEQALQHAKNALKFSPANERLKNNLRIIESVQKSDNRNPPEDPRN